MEEYFLNQITDEFKQKLINQTREEVKNIIDYSSLTKEEQDRVEYLFVQPLYYAKIKSFSNLWFQEKETSVEDILKRTDISDELKKELLSSIAVRSGITFTNIEETSAKIIEKMFLYTTNISMNAEKIKNESSMIKNTVTGSKYIGFHFSDSSFIKNNFYAPFLIDSFKTSYRLSDVYDNYITDEIVTTYKNFNINKVALNNMVILIDKDVKKNSKSVSVSLKQGESGNYIISGNISDIKFGNNFNEKNTSIIMENYCGFGKNTIKIFVEGPITDSINYYEVELDDTTNSLIKEETSGVETFITNPFKVECSIKIRKKEYLNLFTNLSSFKYYDDFFNSLQKAISSISNPYYLPYDYKANVFVNPLVWKELDFSMQGLFLDSSKILKTIDTSLFILRISNIYIEETNETVTL